MRKSSAEKLRDAKRGVQAQMQLNSYEDILKLLCDGGRPADQRRLNPTQYAFNVSDDPIRLYMGVVGCAKTSTACSIAWTRALFQPGSKVIVSRQDYNDLMGTTYVRMTEMLNLLPKGVQVGRDKTPPEKWLIQPVPMLKEDGTFDDRLSEITFMALKEDLGSIEANCWVIDEANEVEEKRVHEIQMRLRAPGENYVTALVCNPPDKHHWLYTACTGKDFQDKYVKEPWVKLYTPKPNENQRNLPADYYTKHAQNMPEDMKQRLIEGSWGSDFGGTPVYKEFKYPTHVRDNLHYQGNGRGYRFWDFGYNRPCVIWAYCDFEGRLIILGSELGEKLEARPWAQKVKAWSKERYPQVDSWTDFGDPAVKQRKDTGSTLFDLHQEGIVMYYMTSTIEFGAKAIRSRLNLLIAGEPAIQFNRSSNHILINGMRGGYKMDKLNREPFKDGYYDHLCLAPETLVATPKGEVPLSTLQVGDAVSTPTGHGTVTAVKQTQASCPTRYLLGVKGKYITASHNHPCLTQRGWVAVDALRDGDYVVTHEPQEDSQDVSAVSGNEVLPVRQVPVSPSRVQPQGVSAPGSVESGPWSHLEGTGDSPQEQEPAGQPALQLGSDDTGRAFASAHDPSSPPLGSKEHCEICRAGCPCMALKSGGFGVAQAAWSYRMGQAAALESAVRYLLEDCDDEGQQATFLRTQLQSGSLQAHACWVRQEAEPGEIWNLTVEPQHAFIANGLVVHNCDALRYGLINLFSGGSDTSPAGHIGELPESIEYQREHDV